MTQNTDKYIGCYRAHFDESLEAVVLFNTIDLSDFLIIDMGDWKNIVVKIDAFIHKMDTNNSSNKLA